jgi:hypothetical protein
MTTKRLLIVGGSDAGISAGLRARELDSGCEVTVVVADCYPNYSICGLPFYLSGEVPDWHALAHRTGKISLVRASTCCWTPRPRPSTQPTML